MSLLTSVNERTLGNSYFAPSTVRIPQLYDVDLAGKILRAGAGVVPIAQSGYFYWDYDSTDLQAIFSITSCQCDKPTGLSYNVTIVPDAPLTGGYLIAPTFDQTIVYNASNKINASAMYSPNALNFPKGTRCYISINMAVDSVTDVTISAGTAVVSLSPSRQFL
jgi:hypothetical protein